MIVPMKKISIVMRTEDAKDSMARLALMGLLHVEHQRVPQAKEIEFLREELSTVVSAIGILDSSSLKSGKTHSAKKIADWKFMAAHIAGLDKKRDQLTEFSHGISAKISDYEPWGDFEPRDLSGLESIRVYVRLYQIPEKDLKTMPEDLIVRQVSELRGMANCAVISREPVNLPFKEVALPAMSLSGMRTRLAETEDAIKAVGEEMSRHLRYREDFTRVKEMLESKIAFYEALSGMGDANGISYIIGYVPYDSVISIVEEAKRQRWSYLVTKPSAADNVPTLVRNPKWVSIIEPVFKLIEVVPGYRELDISLPFLIFFSIFFGMLIGDAGIGLIFMILTALAQSKLGSKVKDKSIFTLIYALSFCAIVWGVLTATYFGQNWLPAYVRPLIPALRNDNSIMALCFFLGAGQLSIAHIWRAILKSPSPMALTDVGWVSVIWGGYFLAKTLIIGDAFPGAALWLFVAGPALVVLFTRLEKNIVRGLGAGVANLLLNFMNSITDIISYLRLFAVGLASVAIADAFTGIALDVGFKNIFTGTAAVLILIIGNSLNVLLGPIAVLVHGVRLNVLEFCGHLDIKWTGFAYRPLKAAGPAVSEKI